MPSPSTLSIARRARLGLAAIIATFVGVACGVGDRSTADYASCESDPECKLGSNCLTLSNAYGDVQAPMCSRACATDAQCTGGGACLGAVTMGTGICWERCPPSGKCNTDFSCQETSEAGVPFSLCMPK